MLPLLLHEARHVIGRENRFVVSNRVHFFGNALQSDSGEVAELAKKTIGSQFWCM